MCNTDSGVGPGMQMYTPDDLSALEDMMAGMEDPYGGGDAGFGEF